MLLGFLSPGELQQSNRRGLGRESFESREIEWTTIGKLNRVEFLCIQIPLKKPDTHTDAPTGGTMCVASYLQILRP